jgi:hypothetical protein
MMSKIVSYRSDERFREEAEKEAVSAKHGKEPHGKTAKPKKKKT